MQMIVEKPDQLALSLVRILGRTGSAVGTGFLFDRSHIVTCAHVVMAALGLTSTPSNAPQESINLNFPFLNDITHQSSIVKWYPFGINGAPTGEDVAVLRLNSLPPQDAKPANLEFRDCTAHPFRTYGFPRGYEDTGINAYGTIRDRLANGWRQLEDDRQYGIEVRPGFSGAPAWDSSLDGVVGMIVAVAAQQSRVSFVIPAHKIQALCGTETVSVRPSGPLKKPTIQQLNASHQTSKLSRLIAGPGTGKSFVIEERTRWLLASGVHPEKIAVVSFTRASSRDLSVRIEDYCRQNTQRNGADVRVTTLHSLALTALRKAQLLDVYPVDPTVLDRWELENIFDLEFSQTTGYQPKRCKQIRLYHEAYWNTGLYNPPNYIHPPVPITNTECNAFVSFHQLTTRAYACVLPGEIVQKCVQNIQSGFIQPVVLLDVEHLIVDEFQDLNNTDLLFVDALIAGGVCCYVAGDDDQSIYSFRFASPQGIQQFPQKYSNVAQHELSECFRCTPSILHLAKALFGPFALPSRVPKTLVSQFDNAEPPLPGIVHRWKFTSAVSEARAIVQSCESLIAQGVKHRDILILISSRKHLLGELKAEFEAQHIEAELPVGDRYIDDASGRFAYSLVRIACDKNRSDYVARRTLLGTLRGVGIGTCSSIRTKVINDNLNFIDLFDQPLKDVFRGRALTALNRARDICNELSNWDPSDIIAVRGNDIAQILLRTYGQTEMQAWLQHITHLPADMTLSELREYLACDVDEQQATLLRKVYKRLCLEEPEGGFLAPKIRIMTMHGVKGLNTQVVFIPGLEEGILPNDDQKKSPGFINEGARLLYVSITRARTACIMSFASSRMIFGAFSQQHPSQYIRDALVTTGQFHQRTEGLSQQEVTEITNTINQISRMQ